MALVDDILAAQGGVIPGGVGDPLNLPYNSAPTVQSLYNATLPTGGLPYGAVPYASNPVAGLYADAAPSALRSMGSGLLSATKGEGLGALAESAGWTGLKGGFGRAIPGLTVAGVGPTLINQLPGNQDVKDFAGNTVAGLGYGMAASAFAPEFAPFLIAGGGLAGLGKATYEQFFGDNTPSGPSFTKQDKQSRNDDLIALMNEVKIPVNQQDGLLRSFTAAWSIAPDDATRQAIFQNAQQTIAQQVAAEATAPSSLTAEQVLATQALASSVMKPYTDQILATGKQSQDFYNQLADSAPSPAIAQLARTIGANKADSGARLSAAYEQQSLLLPSLNALQLANQYGQQAFAYANRPTSSGSTSVNSLIQQAQSGGLGSTGYTGF